MATLKQLAHVASAQCDRPGEWTRDDIERARLRMNEEGRPRGASGPTPNQIWDGRTRIAAEERRRFVAQCARYRGASRAQRQHREASAIDRSAIAKTLIDQGFLLVRRRRITLPI